MKARLHFAAAAALQLAVAAVHFAWLGELARGTAAADVPASYRALLLLAIAAIGLLLAGIGVLAARYAAGGRWREPGAPAFALACALLWACRAGLELRWPLQVPLLGVSGISPAVLAGSVLEALLYLGAWAWSGAMADPCPAPASALLERHPLPVHYQDAYEVPVPAGADLRAALAAFQRLPRWVEALFWLRDQLFARPLGLQAALEEVRRRAREGVLFTVLEEGDGEQLMGEQDRHLDFQVLARIEPGPAPRFVLLTRVRFHGAAGRLYFLPVRPVHRWLVPALLGRAGRDLAAAARRG